MNKIILNTEKYLKGEIDTLEIKQTSYVIQDRVVIHNLVLAPLVNVTFTLEDDALLFFGNVMTIKNVKGQINFISKNHTKLKFHLGIRSEGSNELQIENKVLGNDNKSEIKLRIVSSPNSQISLKTVGILESETKDNEFLEDVKYLNEYPGSITCYPELIVSSNEVVANHNMTVSNIDELNLFYLESKGINKDKAKELIRDSFINIMKREEE